MFFFAVECGFGSTATRPTKTRAPTRSSSTMAGRPAARTARARAFQTTTTTTTLGLGRHGVRSGRRSRRPQAMVRGRRPCPAPRAQARRPHGRRRGRRARLHGFPVQHRAELYSTSPLERLNSEIKLRADVVGIIFPNEAAVTRLIGAPRCSRRMNGPFSVPDT